MSTEVAIVTAKASVMIYNESMRKWIPTGSTASASGQTALSKVQIFQHMQNNTYRIVGRMAQTHEVVINCAITRGLKYNQATPTFHQWRDQRQVYGLNFTSADDANNFANAMLNAIEMTHTSNALTANAGAFNNSNVVSNGIMQQQNQQPQAQLLPQHTAPPARTLSNASCGSQNGCYSEYQQPEIDINDEIVYRNGSDPRLVQQTYSHLMITQQQNNVIYSNLSNGVAVSSPGRIPQPPPPPPAVASNYAPPPTRTSNATGVASTTGALQRNSATLATISSNAPVAPPPPPPLNVATDGKSPSLAQAIADAKLKKTPKPEDSRGQSGSSSKPSDTGSAQPAKPKFSGPPGDMMSDLAQTLARRKQIAEQSQSNGHSKDDCESRGQDLTPKAATESRRIFDKANGRSSTLENGVTESPKTHRKMPSGSSLSSQEENGSAATRPSNHCNGPLKSEQLLTQQEVLEQFKLEIMQDVRREINKAKLEIIEALKSELVNFNMNRR